VRRSSVFERAAAFCELLFNIAAKEINVTVGAASKQGKKTSYHLVIPKKCPPGGFPLKAVMSFLGGATAEASYKTPCPKK
jgi:hypothetical protein